jgi:hypothetical protein
MDEVIRSFNERGIRYLLIGGQAVRLVGMPRFSMDWDFYIPPRDAENFRRLNELLDDALDLPLVPLGPAGQNFIQTYQTKWGIMQFHLGAPGLPAFDEAETRRVMRTLEDGTAVACLSGSDLLACKRAAGRPQDEEDICFLEQLKNMNRLD